MIQIELKKIMVKINPMSVFDFQSLQKNAWAVYHFLAATLGISVDHLWTTDLQKRAINHNTSP